MYKTFQPINAYFNGEIIFVDSDENEYTMNGFTSRPFNQLQNMTVNKKNPKVSTKDLRNMSKESLYKWFTPLMNNYYVTLSETGRLENISRYYEQPFDNNDLLTEVDNALPKLFDLDLVSNGYRDGAYQIRLRFKGNVNYNILIENGATGSKAFSYSVRMLYTNSDFKKHYEFTSQVASKNKHESKINDTYQRLVEALEDLKNCDHFSKQFSDLNINSAKLKMVEIVNKMNLGEKVFEKFEDTLDKVFANNVYEYVRNLWTTAIQNRQGVLFKKVLDQFNNDYFGGSNG